MAMAISNDIKEMGKLRIEEQLEDLIINDGETAVFESKFEYDLKPEYNWYKNGLRIQPNERIIIKEKNNWCYLVIKQATSSDQGLYLLECKQNNKILTTRSHLYVAPKYLHDSAIYHTKQYNAQGVSKHIDSIALTPGNKIVLEARFTFESHSFIWYKNNDVVSQDQRTIINQSKTSASLTIDNAKHTDTGVYYVVAQSEHGYTTSVADVLVGVSDEPPKLIPSIIEYLPDDLETLHGEVVRLFAKACTNMDTTIYWSKNDVKINHESDEYKMINYGKNYVGLLIYIRSMSLAGKYTLTLVDNKSQRTVSTSTLLSINRSPITPPEVNLLRPLESAMACCGSKVSFDCSFELRDPKYFYVIWYIGYYKVERTNSLFNVVCNGGQFLLYIKKFEPCMAGEVVCELRRAWPNKKSATVKRAYASLVMVPRTMIQANALQPSQYTVKSKLHFERDLGNVEIRMDEDPSCAEEVQGAAALNTDYLLKIIYCRLDEEGLFFIRATHGSDRKIIRLTVHRQPNFNNRNGRVTAIEWDDSIFPTQCWYGIDIEHANGIFAEIGVTSRPLIELNPPLDRAISIRIRALIKPMDCAHKAEIYIVPAPEIMMHSHSCHEIQPLELYRSRYTSTEEVIGAGSYGTVKLVQDNDHRAFYAAKVVKISIEMTRHESLREFNIMKNLRHPKLIELIGFYESNNTHVFVMEYCWGGELFDRVVADEYLRETDVYRYIKQICEGLKYMHEMKIIHLDLKPENIVCLSPNSRQIKLIDFGLARMVNEKHPGVICGTKDYVAPEVLDLKPITTASDMWSIGVVTYVLLSGLMPFCGETWLDCTANIIDVAYNYDDIAFNEVSSLAKDFVDHLLLRMPKARMTAVQALNHKWITDGPPLERKVNHMNKMRENLRTYLADYRLKWQRAGNVIKAIHRLRPKARTEQLL